MSLLRRVESRGTAILLLVAVLGAAGAAAALRLPAAIFPSVTFPIVKVIADVGEEPAARMIPAVTRPLEEAIRRVPGMRNVLSTTSRGSTEITARFAWGTDMQVALQRSQAEVARIRPDLPAGARVEVEWMNTSIFPILGYALTSSTESQADLRQLAEYTLKPELTRIPGVSQVQVQGGRKREFQVRLDARALDGRGLSAADVVEAIRRNHQVLSAGLVERNHELYLSLVDGRGEGLRGLADLAVPVPGGVPARLSDLGTVRVADAVSYVRTTADGKPAVLVNLIQQPSANTLAIARGVRELLRQHPELLPAGVRWTSFYDQARFVSSSVGGVRDAIAIGVALAALVLLVFLRDLRATAVAVATLPVSVALVLLGLDASGQTINLMTLGGIAAALGLVADDAIVVVENIDRRREEAGTEDPVTRGVRELLPALVGSSLSTIVVFLPFAFLTGVTGAFFRPLALTMVLALGFSLLLSAFAVPSAVRHLGGGRPRERRGTEGAGRLLRVARWLVRRGLVAAATVLLLLGAAGFLYRHLGTDFLPAMDEGSIILDYWTPPGTSLTDTNAMLDEAEKQILALPDVASYSRRTGTQLGFFITEPNRGDYVIKLKPRGERRPVGEVIEDLRRRIAGLEPAIRTDFGQLLEDNIGDLTGGVPQPIEIKIFGSDQGLLQQKARQTARIIGGVTGVEDIFDGITIAGPALEIRPRAAALARQGLTTEDLHAAVEPALTGTVAGDLRVGERVYDIRVFSRQVADLSELRVRTAAGSLLPLTDLATLSTGSPEAEIDRDDLQSYLAVTARLAGRDLGGAVGEIRRDLGRSLALPAGMHLELGGLYAQQQSSFRGLAAVLVGGMLLVSVVLLFTFGDWRAPLVTALLALAVLAGVFAALLATGMTLNISSLVGAIMMVGIVGENAVFVIDEARRELAAGLPPAEAWARAARRRARPVVMTILATSFALAPLALALGEGAQLLQPLAIAVIGGFVLSGPLVLVVLPALYRALDPHGRLGGRAGSEAAPP